MELLVLGPVEVRRNGESVDCGPTRQRSVLAALGVDAGRPVLTETLIDRVWGDAPPQRARHTLQVYIGRIRQFLRQVCEQDGRPATVARRAGGYVLGIDSDCVDVCQFRELRRRARDPGYADPERAAMLQTAMALWRGTPLLGLDTPWAIEARAAWERERVETALTWAETELRLGHARVLVQPLTAFVAEYPLVEPLVEVLLRALVADGRTAEALQWYGATRARLAEELGSDPSPGLRQLHQAILRGELGGRDRGVPVYSVRRAPAQLPMAVSGFIGRRQAMAQLDQILATRDPAGSEIAVISGIAGVGKTTLAVHWARQRGDRLPDGQLYVNLRGFDPRGPITATEAIRGFIDALNVVPQRIPAAFDALVGLYRTQLAGRRMMIVLDNARDADQVRPLLPGAPGCLVLVTSRNRLASLVAAEGAHEVVLDALSIDESRQMLARRLGSQRIGAESPAVDQVIDRCGGLPIALAIVAARAAARPAPQLATLAAEIRGTAGLSALSVGEDLVADIRSVFSWSYHLLDRQAAKAFRLLGLHPGRDISIDGAASIAGLSSSAARTYLNELVRTSLVTEVEHDRFSMHDLLRSYAEGRALAEETAADRDEAVARMLDHYLHTAVAGALLLDPRRQPIPVAEPRRGTSITDLADHDDAMRWFTANRSSLAAVADLAERAGWHTHLWQLAWATANFLDRQVHWQELAATQEKALAAAVRLADPVGQAHAHRGAGRAHARLGAYADAHRHLRHALELFRELGDVGMEANSRLDRAWVFARQVDHRRALDHAEHALALYRSLGHPGRADALNAVGWYLAKLGDPRAAIAYCEEAFALHHEFANPHGEANAWDSLGYAYVQLRDYRQAEACYQNAVDLLRREGDRFNEANALLSLGDAKRAGGDTVAARVAWRAALEILTDLDHPDADPVRLRLAEA
jgi:DNA-binding SARP family transcriptional activator/tetratricopeptide (TPR) repeat protein